jgi:two-component system sensor histidine kinase KdpD
MIQNSVTSKNLIWRFLGLAPWALLLSTLVFPPAWLSLSLASVLLILVSAVGSLLVPLMWSLCLNAFAVMIFNYNLVPPIHTFSVDLVEDGALLVTMMSVSGLISYLLQREKLNALQKQQLAQRTLQLMYWSEALREVDEPQQQLLRLFDLISDLTHAGAGMVLGFLEPEHSAGVQLNSEQMAGFQACLSANQALGVGTGRYENLDDLFLPMRGKTRAYGVCVFQGGMPAGQLGLKANVQALLDQMGLACERKAHALNAETAREAAQLQNTRNLFLTSIAHDQRTPLASIMTSASAILEQVDQLSKAQISHYAALIQAEAQQVERLTDNTLTLARLSGEQVQVPMEWESAEDIVASVFQRLRQRSLSHIPQVQVQGGLPLIYCNMVLVEQVLDNLIDNALKHSGVPDSLRIKVHQQGEQVWFEVCDQGLGMQGKSQKLGDQARGLGIGLRLCKAVAVVHYGSLNHEHLGAAGFVVRLALPLTQPAGGKP